MTNFTLPYVARYPRAFYLFIPIPVGLMFYLLLFQFQEVVRYWHEHNWIVRILMLVVGFGVIPVGLMDVLRLRTTFDSLGIEHRSGLGRTTRRLYSEVSSFDYKPSRSLTIHFSNGEKVKVYAATADLEKVAELVETKAGKDIHTTVR